jgi:hypothetical protein
MEQHSSHTYKSIYLSVDIPELLLPIWVAANMEATDEARVTSGKVEDIISKVLLSPQLLG